MASSLRFWIVLGFFLFPSAVPAADAEPLEAWMPDDVVGYVKLSGLGARIEELLSSDLRRELESIDAVKAALSEGGLRKFQKGLEDIRNATGIEPLKLFQDLLGREVLVGARFGFGGPEVIVLTRTAGEKELEESLKTVKNAIEQRGVFLATTESMHGDRKIETLAEKVSHTRIGPVWVASSTKSAVERVIDLAGGKSTASVQKSAIFQKSTGSTLKDAIISVAVRPQFIPNYNIPDRADNALGSLLIGGWLGALESSELLAASLGFKDGSLELKVSSVLGERAKNEKEWQKFAGFFPEIVPDSVKERLEKRGILAITELRRNLAQWWENREALLTPGAAGSLIEFSQVMSVVFGGRNFQDEILPELGPTITIVARNQEYKSLKEKPQPAIPAFAGIFQLKNAKETSQDVVAAYYTMVGIINADRAQKKKEGGMAMIPKPEKVGDIDMHTVSLNTAMAKDAQPGMLHNFTPSLAIVGTRMVLSSSAELARILIEELPKVEEGKTGVAKSSDTITVDGEAVRSILGANREVLVADTMMKKGASKAEAEGQIQLLFDVLKHLRDLRIESTRRGEAVELDVKLRTSLGGQPGNKEPAVKEATERKAVKL